MNAPNSSAQAQSWRRRTAAVFAAVGALIMSSGLVMITAPSAQADPPEKVGVCHRKANGDYVFLRVSTNGAGEPNGHASHLEGAPGSVSEAPDYIMTSPSVPIGVDTDDEFKAWCQGKNSDVTTVSPAVLDITPITACGGTGEVARPRGNNRDIDYSIPGDTWTGLVGDVTVTATLLDDSVQFDSPLPGSWILDEGEGTTASWTISFGSSTALCTTGTLAVAWGANGTCGVHGWIQRPSSTGVTYTIDGLDTTAAWAVTTGDHIIRATLTADSFAAGYDPAWSVIGTTATRTIRLGSYAGDCVDVPVLPRPRGASCDGPGSFTLPTTPGFSWEISPNYTGPGTYTVTVTTLSGQFAGGSNEHTYPAFSVEAQMVCGGTPDPVIPDPEVTTVAPNYPSANDATCSRNGELSVPAQPDGVLVTQSGSVPGDVTFTFAPAEGFAFADGTDTEVTVPVEARLGGDECILGEEATKPKPKPKPRDRAPIVLGSQAAVPTAVAAGLSGLPTTSVSSTSSPRLAQALVAGGLLMLIAGGSMGLGRRTRGAHES